jgi:hypothetical protein
MIKEFEDRNIFGLVGIRETNEFEDILNTYNVLMGEDNSILQFIPKPALKGLVSYVHGTGYAVLKNRVLSYALKFNKNVELAKELPIFIQTAIDSGEEVKGFNIGSKYDLINTLNELDRANIRVG